MFYLTTHSTHFIYGYMSSAIWLRTILKVRKETRFRHIGYSYRLTARVLLYAPSHRQDNTYHSLCYTSRGTINSSVDSWRKEGNVLFIDSLKTFYLWLYVVRHMIREPFRFSEKKNAIATRTLMVRWVLHGGPIKLFLVPASTPQLV